ncbi:MAG: tRNA lysidine(34) synthetase TilS [Hespellia sp.]|nr:tRNA lysidine(34) synthetase TilS [Hespellia sp.]
MEAKDIFDRVWKDLQEYHMIAAGDRLVAGISGGADSVCLLFMLLQCSQKLPFTLTVVHVNHGLRGREADRDQAFVEALCRKYQVSCRVFREDVRDYAARNGLTEEEAGRIVRRNCFLQVKEEAHADKIVLAHHRNDNAETLLMNLARGTGLTGLGGIRPVNGVFIRPLLCLERREIEQWLQEKGLTWCTDSSNDSDHYTRNRIRHQVIPVLEEQVNEKTVLHFAEMMEQMRGLKDYIDLQLDQVWRRCVEKKQDQGFVIRESTWKQEHDYLQTELIRKCMICLAKSEKDISLIHVQQVRQLFNKQTGRRLDLPYKMQAVRVYDGILLQKESYESSSIGSETVVLNIPGKTRIPWNNMEICCTIFRNEGKFLINPVQQNPYTKWFDYDIIKKILTVRTRRAGDYLVINENGSKQKLKAFFINEKIPAEIREKIPLIACGEEILWIPGYRRSSACLVKTTTKEILQIQMNGGKGNGRKY